MSSPFSTFEEFQGAIDGPTGGAIYTFAGSPAINTIALLLSVGIFLWFLVRTFTTHYDVPAIDRSLNHLSAFIVAGLISLAGAEHRPTAQPNQPAETRAEAVSHRPGPGAAVGLLGLVGLGGQQLRSKAALKGSSRRPGRYRDITRRG